MFKVIRPRAKLSWSLIVRCASTSNAQQSTFTPKVIATVPPSLHAYLFETPVPSTAVVDQRLDLLKLPPLNGSLEEHTFSIASEQCGEYRSLLDTAAKWNLAKLPKRPDEWIFRKGWTRYAKGGSVEQVPYPLEDVFVFDVEVAVQDCPLPVIAVALSEQAWYCWFSSRLFESNDVIAPSLPTQENLIPLGGHDRPRVVIGHNVAYDRVRSREPYNRKQSQLRFWDTMSMSISMYGMADHQVPVYESKDHVYDEELRVPMNWKDTWKSRVTKNGLASVHEFLIKDGEPMKKELQDFFVKHSLADIRENVQMLTMYCAGDVKGTLEIFQKLMPRFYECFPHPATMCGMLEMIDAYLPINQYWKMFYERSEAESSTIGNVAASGIATLGRQMIRENSSFDGDIWMWNVDMSIKKKSQTPTWFTGMFDSKAAAEADPTSISAEHMKMKSNMIPLLFGLCYGPYPLHYIREHGWGYLVPATKKESKKTFNDSIPFRKILDFVEEKKLEWGDGVLLDQDRKKANIFRDFDFYQLDHPAGKGNVGYPVTKHTFADIEQKVLRCSRGEEYFDAYVNYIKNATFWKSFRDRYKSELPIWYPETRKESPETMEGALSPAVCPAGTVSRRSVHKLWVTATNANEDDRIGTGLKSMIQAGTGTVFVGADVDSQEQWIAALCGDASRAERLPLADRVPGCSPFSNMMLAGSKSDGSDLHSVVAKDLKIGRNDAKTLNYARLYGAGEKNAIEHLVKCGTKEKEAEQKARELFRITKGAKHSFRRLHPLANALFEEFLSEGENSDKEGYLCIGGRYYLLAWESARCATTLDFEDWVVDRILKEKGIEESGEKQNEMRSKTIRALYEDIGRTIMLYSGGYESDTFNFLEVASLSDDLRTPVLGCKLSTSLSPLPEDTPGAELFALKYKRSVINWIVQSSAVDYLHLMLVYIRWLCGRYDIDARFSLSIHDEVRYVVNEVDAERFALALMYANLFVRAMMSTKLGIQQLPMSVAFFSQVDKDTVLRKEVTARCVNPDGTVVPPGEALDIYEVIKRTNGSLEK